jgi:multisubunit Na+/H+ antiporter MnhF subunit
VTFGLIGAAEVLFGGGFGLCLLALVRKGTVRRLVVLETASPLVTLVLLLMAQGYDRLSYVDVGLVLAAVSFAGCLVYARFLERWL